MTFKILKSEADKVAADFRGAVEAYRQAMLAHRFSPPAQGHAPAVPEVEAVPDTPAIPPKGPLPGRPRIPGRPSRPAIPEQPARPGVPRPTHHPVIESCLRRVQTPNQPDDFVADYEIIDDTPPPPTLKERKLILLSKVHDKEHELLNKVWPSGKRRLDAMNANKIMAKVENAREQEEIKFVEEIISKQEKMSEISYEAATFTSEIEDLTEETIDNWKFEFTE